MKLVTVATHIDGYMPWLKKSCDRYKTTLYTLGLGEEWQGYNWKFLKMKEFLKSVDPNEIICFMDAYDVILLRDPSSLEEDFLSFCKLTGKKIIVGCDKPKPMYMKVLAYATFGKCDDEMLNSGTYIGKASDLLYMINEMSRISNDDPSVDDQVLLKDWCSMNTNLIHIDCDIYSSTKDVLNALDICIGNDTIIMFDEYFNYQFYKNHEYKAFMEYIEKTGKGFEYIARSEVQAAVRIL
jgi:hypothetical protein